MDKHYSLTDLLDQEEALQFTVFNNDIDWQLGSQLKAIAEYNKSAVAIEVYAFNQVIFSYAIPLLTISVE